MITGTATVKKPIKYLGDSKFELTLTDLTSNDVNELLATNGTRIAYRFNAAMDYGGEFRTEPENGKLYDVVNGVVENVRPAGDDEEASCDTCVHWVDWPDGNDAEKMTKICEIGSNPENCENCKGYTPIVDLGAGEDETEPANISCETCINIDSNKCPGAKNKEYNVCNNYEFWNKVRK